jgi:hypothetical protein
VHGLELSSGEGVEHIGHPLALNGLDGMIDSRPTCLKRFSSKLIPQFLKGLNDFLPFQTSQGNVLQIAVDVCTSDEGVMVTFDDEVEFDVLVILHERFKRGRYKGFPDSR